jgi:hypothetical protein
VLLLSMKMAPQVLLPAGAIRALETCSYQEFTMVGVIGHKGICWGTPSP